MSRQQNTTNTSHGGPPLAPSRRLYGPFYRLKSPTQSDDTAEKQMRTNEVWGRPRQYSDIPQVQAYSGTLPSDREGIEFMTEVEPDRGTAPGSVRWTGPRTGVVVEDEFAKIPVVITKNSQQADGIWRASEPPVTGERTDRTIRQAEMIAALEEKRVVLQGSEL